jgi:biofilm PGA synthesis lipoprotein PgaB
MMLRLLFVCTLMLLFATAMSSRVLAAPAPGQFLSLCYHNVEDSDPDPMFEGVSTSHLIDQIGWLLSNGYKAISLNDLIAARHGRKALPSKAVLFTFDDGYESVYTRVFPILKAFRIPAIIGLVDAWMKGGPKSTVHYGSMKMSRSAFVTWDQVREMEGSGLVEAVSHTDALHYNVLADPQGNVEPAVVTQVYHPKTGRYESAGHLARRLDSDFKLSADTIERETGHRPRAMIWPYGAYSNTSIQLARHNGMPITFTLDDGLGSVEHLSSVPRYLIAHDPELDYFVKSVEIADKVRPFRMVQIDLDYVYDKDPAQLERNLDALVQRIADMKINAVFLQAFADPSGDGVARELYFPNHYLPMRADLFNRVSWQLRIRAHVKVFGWLPVLTYGFDDSITPVTAWNSETKTAEINPASYHRVSPFDKEARRRIIGIYEDMARDAAIDGILFHDDALLSDYEDASPVALKAYKAAGFPATIDAIRADRAMLQKWSAFKTDVLIAFTQELTKHVAKYRQPLLTVRNIYAPVVLKPESQEWFAQDYDRFLGAYDYTAIMAMPKMENVPDNEATDWMQDLVDAAARRPGGLDHTIFELQAVDWRKQGEGNDRAIPASELGDEMRFLEMNGAMNFGYYPDDFVTNTPDADVLHREFSLQTYPYRP